MKNVKKNILESSFEVFFTDYRMKFALFHWFGFVFVN